MNFNTNNRVKLSSEFKNTNTQNIQNIPNISKSYDIKSFKQFDNNNNISNELNKIQDKHSKTQSRMDIQSIIDMCTKKLDYDPIHKKALLLRASSYIKNKDFDNVL